MQQDMTVGKPMGLIIRFAIPMFIGNVFQQLYNMIDSIVVGRFVSANALAAVGACAPAYSLILALVSGLTTGAAVIISQNYGTKDDNKVRTAYISSLVLVLLSGALLMVVGTLTSKYLLTILGTPTSLMKDCQNYLKIMFIGIFATCLYNGMASFLRAIGNSFIPLVSLIVASGLNIVLDLVFVLQFHLGVVGVAIATILAQLISGIYCLIYIKRKVPQYWAGLSDLKADHEMLMNMIRIGIPAAISSSIVSISTMFLQKAVNAYGTEVMAAYTAGQRTEQICFCLSFAIGSAVGTFCAQNIGAGKKDRVILGFRTGCLITLVYNLVVGGITFLGARYILMLFTSNENVISIGIGIVRITTVFAPVLGLVFIFQNFLRNTSDVKPTIWMSLAEVVARGSLGFVFSALFGYAGIWWATPVGWTGAACIGYWRYRSNKWVEKSGVEKMTL